MKLRFNILTPNNTGNPDYDICGQGSSVTPNSNLSVTLKLNNTIIFSQSNLGGIWALPVTPFTVGSKTVTNFTYNALTGFIIDIQSNDTINTVDTFEVNISKTGYQSYSNIFKLFDYDLGNSGLVSGSNPNFDFYLVKDLNNLDINGYQTKAFSKFISYREPFTNNIYFYNAVGTQGNITYKRNDTLAVIGSGNSGILCNELGIDISQTINVYDIYGSLKDTCSTTNTIPYYNWLPIINVSVDCSPACDETCVSTLGTGKFKTYIDLTTLSCINVDSNEIYPYHNTPYLYIRNTFYDYQGNQIAVLTSNISIGDCGNTCPESPIELPIPDLPNLGDVVIVTEFFVLANADMNFNDYYIKCSQSTLISRCNWYTITETDNCGEFKVSNCSVDSTTLTVKQLQEDKTFLTIATFPIEPLSSSTVVLQADGVYTFEVPSKTDGEVEIYTIINDCGLEACLFTKLGGLICGKHDDTCIASIKNYYDFNAFVLNLHSYYALLNEEFNFNYIYKVIDIKKLNDLYTIKQYLDNLASYCIASCDTCNCGK